MWYLIYAITVVLAWETKKYYEAIDTTNLFTVMRDDMKVALCGEKDFLAILSVFFVYAITILMPYFNLAPTFVLWAGFGVDKFRKSNIITKEQNNKMTAFVMKALYNKNCEDKK
ncbi:MAG: hypothetical protein KAI79_06790 [Bacteroidales bacterium]|nr:hypothetical protein [Bacteroidales bacterium]